MSKLWTAFLCLAFSCHAGIADHYRKLEYKWGCTAPEKIDYVYLLNLDQRPERWNDSILKLLPYDIFPERFPGIYGWTIPVEILNDMSVPFGHGMWTGKESVMVFPPDKNGAPEWIWLDGSRYGTGCFSGWTVKGTIGCSLSHLSILQDAYDAGYDTIWVLEDDFSIIRNPHELTESIEHLDALVGEKGWDVLYTDCDYLTVDPDKELQPQIPYMWRPDMPDFDLQKLIRHQEIGGEFIKIGSRMRAHSIIYRRHGIEKILAFYKAHNNFLPYDQELPMLPGIQLFVIKNSIVSVHERTTDTRYQHFR